MLVYTRKLMILLTDVILINAAVILSLFIRFEGNVPAQYMHAFIKSFLVFTLVKTLINYLFGLYGSLWRYASIEELMKVIIAVTAGGAASIFLSWILHYGFPRSIPIISWMITIILLGGSRFSYRVARRLRNRWSKEDFAAKRVLIIGAGDAGVMVLRELKDYHVGGYEPVAVLDDDRWKQGTKILGVPVKGGVDKIKQVAAEEKIDEIIIAMPSAGKKRISEIAKLCQQTKCKLKTLPGIYEIIDNRVTVKSIRDVNIEDLLGREEIKLNTAEIASYLQNETVLVTGGGGSIGSELCRQIARYNPRKLIILDIYENNAYDLQNELLHRYKSLDLKVVIASVRDKQRLQEVFRTYKPGVVFHAAAHKHVPLMEENPTEAIKNNVVGTLNTAQCADEFGVKRFVLISTDKAVNPTNIMGATKRVAEMIIQAMDKTSPTEFVAVRFGNVLGSNGSVIPLFRRQIAQGGPVTVTHSDITRFFMTIPEAARLVIQAGAMAQGGEIFVLDMGEPVKIAELAKDLIRLSGLEPDVDIRIEYTGLRPGEKLYEELLLSEEGLQATKQQGIFVAKPMDVRYAEVLRHIRALEVSMGNTEELKECMAGIVPTYSYGRAQEQIAAGDEFRLAFEH